MMEPDVSLEELLEDGWDVKEGTEALGNIVVPSDDDEELAQ